MATTNSPTITPLSFVVWTFPFKISIPVCTTFPAAALLPLNNLIYADSGLFAFNCTGHAKPPSGNTSYVVVPLPATEFVWSKYWSISSKAIAKSS